MPKRPTRIVMIESPYNLPGVSRDDCVRYALWCCHDSAVNRREAPLASHLFYTQFLPEDKESRAYGLACRDLVARATVAAVARYVDLGETGGMYRDVDCTAVVETRRLPADLLARYKAGERPRGTLVCVGAS